MLLPPPWASSGQLPPVTVIHLVGQVAPSIHQPDDFALVAQAALEVAHHGDVAVGGAHPVGVGGHRQIALRRDRRPGRNREIDPIDETPAGDIHRRARRDCTAR